LEAAGADLVVLAGFMRVLTPVFVERFAGRLLNIHPSLLPDFRGLHTHERALAAGVQQHGCTVHFVTPELDAGPSIVQGVVPVQAEDTPQTLAQRVQAQEHRVYPLAVGWLAAGRLALTADGVVLDGQLLEAPVQVRAEDELAGR
ncbi:MAG: phosphoribosylglycinamide formyltransferase, partial [Halorhodospira sp.]